MHSSPEGMSLTLHFSLYNRLCAFTHPRATRFRAVARVPHVRTFTFFKLKKSITPSASFAELHRDNDHDLRHVRRIWIGVLWPV